MTEELQEELRVYKRTKSSEVDVEPLLAVDRIAGTLISARIARGLTQKQLASLVGLKEQQIQRYEARDYAYVDLARMQEIARALVSDPSAGSAHKQAQG